MDFEQIEKLMAKLESSKLKKLVIKQGDFELQLEKEGEVQYVSAPTQSRPTFSDNSPETMFHKADSATHKQESEGTYIKAPLVGTFYSSPSPKDSDFVKVGDSVKKGQALCIIEAMKVMNEIHADQSGIIVKILAEKGQPVEFGQNLFEIKYA